MQHRPNRLTQSRWVFYVITALVLSSMLSVSVLGADSAKDRIVLSANPKQGTDVGPDLQLRPNVEQGFYVYVRNPAKVDKKFRVELLAGDEVAKSEIVTVAKGGESKRVSFGKPVPMGPGAQAVGAWSLKGPPFRFVLKLFDDQDPKPLEERRVGVTVLEPRQYVEVSENSNYDPTRNQLWIEVRAKEDSSLSLPLFSGPDCPVELELIPERIPGYVSDPKRPATYSAPLQKEKGGRAHLFVGKLQFQGSHSRKGLVYLTVDGYKRAFILKTTFGGEGSERQLEPAVSPQPSLRLMVPPYSRPVPNYQVCLEVDNSRRDVVLEVGVDRARNGVFETKQLNGNREIRVTMNPAGPEGALLFKTPVRDWCLDFDLSNMLGERRVRARLLEDGGPKVVLDEKEDKTDQVVKSVIIANSPPPPESASFFKPPTKVVRGTPVEVKAKAIDPDSGIQEVNFFVGTPIPDDKAPPGEKVPPGARIVKGQKNSEGTWSAKVPFPADRDSKSIKVSAQFVNGVGLSTFDTITVDIDDPTKSKDEPMGGTIKGKVVRGELGQPALEVTLTDSTGAAKGKTKTNDAGEFTFKDVAPGKYKVGSSNPVSQLKGEAEVTLEAGKTAEATIELFLSRK